MSAHPIDRRSFLTAALGAAAVSAIPAVGSAAAHAAVPFPAPQSRAPRYAYVGGYTSTRRQGRAPGISVFAVDAPGRWTLIQQHRVPVDNPSYVITDRANRTLYAVHGDLGSVTSHRIDPADGTLTLLGVHDSGGTNPVHLALSPDERFLLVANYATGTLAVLPRRDDGTLSANPTQILTLVGAAGPLADDQHGPQPHHLRFDASTRHVLVPDKGTDRIHRIGFDPAHGTLTDLGSPYLAAPGSGPRHLAFHPTLPAAYLVDELSSHITVLGYDSATTTIPAAQHLSTVPAGFDGASTGAAIVVTTSGRHVFVSNRGHDSIAVFEVSLLGTLGAPSFVSSGGAQPRFMTLDPTGSTLYVGNQKTDTITAHAVETAAGPLIPIGEPIGVGTPSTIVFAP